MAHFTRGYFKMDREAFDYFAKDHATYMVLTYLIAKARYKPGTGHFKNYKAPVARGQVMTSARSIADFLGIAESSAKYILARLEERQTITQISVHNRYRLITVVNYDKYQSFGEENEADSEDKSGDKTRDQEKTNTDTFEKNTYDYRPYKISSVINHSDIPDQVDASCLPLSDRLAQDWRPIGASLAQDWRPNCRPDKYITIELNGDKPARIDASERPNWRPIGASLAQDSRPIGDRLATIQNACNAGDAGNAEMQESFAGRRSVARQADPVIKLSQRARTADIWDAYSKAMLIVHRAAPNRGVQLNSLMCQLVDALGPDAPATAEYYVFNEHRDWIVQARHPMAELVKNCHKYDINRRTGTKVTTIDAQAIERDSHLNDVKHRVLAKYNGGNVGK